MSSIIPIAFLDTFELAASLRTRMGEFKPQGDVSVIPIRGPRREADDPDDAEGFVSYRAAAKWPELKTTLSRINRIGDQLGGVEYGRIGLELLAPGQCLDWRLDDSDYIARFDHAHLPIRTNPAALVYSGTASAYLPQGQLTAINRRVRHSAVNLGEWPRIHLVVDFRKKGDTP